MKFKAHKYQEKAIEWIEDHPRCLLFLDMGLGKTVSTLTALQNLKDWGECRRVLVIAPKKVAESTWATEVEKWDHLGLTVTFVGGTPRQRERALADPTDIHVMARDNVVWLLERLGKSPFPFDTVVLDELTSFKNPRSQRFKALRKMTAKVPRVIGLTGTPTPNGLLDLWGQVYCIDRGERLGKYVTHYRDRWFDWVEHNNIIIRIWPKPGAEGEIMEKISDIALTMTARDFLDMPPMVEHDVRVALPEKSVQGYIDFQKEKILEASTGPITAASAAALSGKLSQYANGAVYDEERRVNEIHDSKLEALDEILEATPTPILCFYQYEHDRDRIMKRFGKLKPRAYSGVQDLEDWNAGRIRLLLAHPASTAFGLNMQGGGHTIVWFSTGWNLELYQQANARLHRQGQKRPVTVHRIITAGTIDERMTEAISGKAGAQNRFINEMKKLIQTKTPADG